MIPSDIRVEALVYEVTIGLWRLEIMTTQWNGYWICQLSRPEHRPLAMLIDLDDLTGICLGLRSCINNAHQKPVKTTQMYTFLARGLPTQSSDAGAISATAEWKADQPETVTLCFYPGDRSENIYLAMALKDAMRVCDAFSIQYNETSDKQAWTPRYPRQGGTAPRT